MAVGLSLTLTACTRQYDLQAIELNGAIAFLPRENHGTGCLSDFKVMSASGQEVWVLDGGQYHSPPCQNRFPIVYGTVPKGMEEVTKAQPLRPGATYKLLAWDGDGYTGAFRFHTGIVIDNLAKAD